MSQPTRSYGWSCGACSARRTDYRSSELAERAIIRHYDTEHPSKAQEIHDLALLGVSRASLTEPTQSEDVIRYEPEPGPAVVDDEDGEDDEP